MNSTLQDIFFQLLRIGLWQKGDLVLKKSLSAQDWTALYAYATTHTVEGIIYDSFSFLDESQLPPQALRLQWTVRIDQIERHNAKMNKVIANQYQTFTKQGLHPILQKGQGVASCYLKPEHRVCGDIDWYFREGGYAKAREFLKTQNQDFTDTLGFSLSYVLKGIEVEHHLKFFDLRSPFKATYLQKLLKEYEKKEQTLQISEFAIHISAPELQILQVNVHILKHMISFGIGCRQICDAARLYTSYKDKIDAQALHEMYKKTGILKWIHVLHHILVHHIGLPKDDLPFEIPPKTQSDWMLTEIWHGGNFGYYDDRFVNGKIIKTISVHPDGAKRLWGNFKRYFPYAPQEALFFPIKHFYGKFFEIDKD